MNVRCTGDKGGSPMGGFLLSLPRGQGSMSRRDHIHYPSKRRKAVCDPDKEFLFVDHSHSLVPYETAWRWQKTAMEQLCTSTAPDVVLLVQHPPVFTLGAGSSERHLKFDASNPPLPLYQTERGGEVTFHGPGQLVLYPILNLKRHECDLHWYLRQLEQVVIRTLWEVSGLSGERFEGLTGVWFKKSKIAAIGVRAKRWITYHGLALNVAMDLAPYSLITPCGISDYPVGSVKECILSEFYPDVVSETFPDDDLLQEYRFGLIDSFQEVFQRSSVETSLHEVISSQASL